MLEIDVDIGRFTALLADESLEQHVATRGIHFCHAQAVTHGGIGRRSASLTQNVLAAGEPHDVVDRQEIRLVREIADQLQFVFDLFLHRVRNAIRKPPMRTDIRFLTQIRLVRKAYWNKLVGILIPEFIQRERAALQHAQRFGQRVLGI
ncbi:hypothetical protein AWB81_08129 [Caballeronia arationis]|nr:hypothetical protein AWB81_08129 [Caballeronia arationis]